ncbi:MFS transporter [Streptomyces vinaceus]
MPGPAWPARQPAGGAAVQRGPEAKWTLATALLGFFVITLDTHVVNVAMPDIGTRLGGGIKGMQWVVDGYTLTFAAFMLSAGAFADRLGARRAFAIGLGMFVAASAACGASSDLRMLVAARLVQGMGAAVMTPASLALIRQAYADAAERAWAISLWVASGAAASAVGAVAGGLLAELSWRMIFFINVPVGAITLALTVLVAPSPRHSVHFDWIGQTLAILAIGGLTYGAIEAGSDGGSLSLARLAAAAGTASASAFLIAEARVRHPMVPLSLLRSRIMGAAMTVGFAVNAAFYGTLFLVSLSLQQTRHLSALATGLVFLPMAVVIAVANVFTARLGGRFTQRTAISAGQVLAAAGLALFAAMARESTPVWLFALLMVPVGTGCALAVPALTSLLLEGIPAERAGTAGALLNTSRQLGCALAVAVFGHLVAGRTAVPQGLCAGLLGAAALLAVTALIGLRIAPPRGNPSPCSSSSGFGGEEQHQRGEPEPPGLPTEEDGPATL